MTALPNADKAKGLPRKPKKTGNHKPSPSSVKLMKPPSIIDEETGVSVEYAWQNNHKWFVLRATYGREAKAADLITTLGGIAYLPMHHVVEKKGRHISHRLAPLLQQFVFVYATDDEINKYVRETPQLSFLTFYYNHFTTAANGYNPPLTVPYCQMINFIKVTTVDNIYTMSVSKEQVHYKSNDIVRIVSGDFKGVKGRVARVKGNQRVVVEIQGVGIIATAYIPTALLERVEPAK